MDGKGVSVHARGQPDLSLAGSNELEASWGREDEWGQGSTRRTKREYMEGRLEKSFEESLEESLGGAWAPFSRLGVWYWPCGVLTLKSSRLDELAMNDDQGRQDREEVEGRVTANGENRHGRGAKERLMDDEAMGSVVPTEKKEARFQFWDEFTYYILSRRHYLVCRYLAICNPYKVTSGPTPAYKGNSDPVFAYKALPTASCRTFQIRASQIFSDLDSSATVLPKVGRERRGKEWWICQTSLSVREIKVEYILGKYLIGRVTKHRAEENYEAERWLSSWCGDIWRGEKEI
ncbi:hypothetical protein B0H11DRAFT_1899808 [Mycena galericulata]|nr:hypothetical protein B0H11DRAFT_1899808 [Mycena galericulata]